MKIWARWVVAAALGWAAGGCGGDEVPAPAPSSACPEQDRAAGGECVGAPAEPVCAAELCADGAACARVIQVHDDAGLEATLAQASAGDCVALAPGSYGDALLPPGVSLLGRSAAEVSVARVEVEAGAGALVRGLSIGAGGMLVREAAEGVRLESARVAGSAGDGITVEPGAALAIADVTIEGSDRIGLLAFEGSDVSVERSVLAANAYAAVWTQALCGLGCTCAAPAKLALRRSILRDNGAYGAVLFGTLGAITAVDVKGTTGDPQQFQRGGAGITAAGCSDVVAKRLRVLDNHDYGVLLERSAAVLGEEGVDGDVEIRGNTVGLWVNAAPGRPVTVTGALIDENRGVGVGVAGDVEGGLPGEERSFVFCRSAVSRTAREMLPAFGADPGAQPAEIGHGLTWLNAALDTGGGDPAAPVRVTIDEVALGDNAGASLLIDGAASGSLTGLVFQGGDAEKGILQQNLGGAAPLSPPAGAPFSSTNDRTIDVPAPRSAPPTEG